MKNYYLTVSLVLLFSTACLAQRSDSAQLYFNKAIAEKGSRHFMQEAKLLDTAIQFNKQFKDAYLELGFAHLEMRKTDQALAAFTKVIELDPQNTAAIRELTDLYFSYHQYQKAIDFARKCTDCPNADRVIAMSAYAQEDYATATAGLAKILAKNPNDAEATYAMGRSYLDMEEYKKAVPFYTKAIELDVTKSNWMYELGLLYYTLNDFAHAKELFVKAGDNGYPKSSDYLENFGYACIYSGDFERGEQLLLSILAKKPGNKEILRDIAEAYYNQKMYDKSLDFCQKLMELNDKDAKALYQAGLCFQKKGQKDKGQGMCDKAIEMDPSLASHRTKMEMPGM